jgi:hypothetical protein
MVKFFCGSRGKIQCFYISVGAAEGALQHFGRGIPLLFFKVHHKTVILRAGDFFRSFRVSGTLNRFVFSAHLIDVLLPLRKTVILSAAPLRSIA